MLTVPMGVARASTIPDDAIAASTRLTLAVIVTGWPTNTVLGAVANTMVVGIFAAGSVPSETRAIPLNVNVKVTFLHAS